MNVRLNYTLSMYSIIKLEVNFVSLNSELCTLPNDED